MTTSEILSVVESLSKAIEREEKLCEQRITFFLTIGTATIGVVNVLERIHQSTSDQFFWSMLGVLISLFLYGIHTLNRLNWRYISILIWRNQMNNAFQELSSRSPLIENHMEIRHRFDERVQSSWLLGTLQGSPAEFMYITNALIVTGIFLTIMLREHCLAHHIIPICVIVFIITVVLLWKICVWIRKKFIR